MKLALPTHRPTQDMQLIYSPMNMTTFFHVLSTLYKNGYPAHWLAEAPALLLLNRVKTTVRPPRSYPLKIAEANTEFALG